MERDFYIEVNCLQKNHADERVCGDVFLSRRIKEEGRLIIVLSDGIGHGIKANILATLTATLAVNFTQEHKSAEKIAGIIMRTLPVDSVKETNYATFTIIEIDAEGIVRILEYENPKTLILTGSRPFEPEWNGIVLESEKHREKEILGCTFTAEKEDRIIFCTDGVTQSGLGSEKYPMGWGEENFSMLIREVVKEENDISAVKLSTKVISRANLNDNFFPKDDMSCGVIYFRDPRKLLICTGPPLEETDDLEFARLFDEFTGKKIICGATTADLLARELNREITDSNEISDIDLPPVAHMEGVEIITEGILTLSKVNEILKAYSQATKLGKGPADEIVRRLLESDEIHFQVGTKINVAHQDPSLPVELELRRTVIHRIARVLEEKFLKEVKMRFY
ncbi:MAG: SpoIIE family protein phosphatase [Bacteroidetes bacterium]|nr:SpoIIE family protein phosphatase [Bacteroidota bacterium]